MSTKNNPGEYDGYAKAHPDEPMFVLLGRDPDAPMLVRLWASIRARSGELPEKVAEALRVANDMEEWRRTGPAGVRENEARSADECATCSHDRKQHVGPGGCCVAEVRGEAGGMCQCDGFE